MSSDLNLIKELRNKTGAGFLDCKTALSESKNDIEKAVEYLRKKGLSKASKKSSRETNEGAIGFYQNNNISVMIKINTETDFAAKSDVFLKFIDDLGNLIINSNKIDIDKDIFMQMIIKDMTVKDYFDNMIAKIGENLVLDELFVSPQQFLCGKSFYQKVPYLQEVDCLDHLYMAKDLFQS